MEIAVVVFFLTLLGGIVFLAVLLLLYKLFKRRQG